MSILREKHESKIRLSSSASSGHLSSAASVHLSYFRRRNIQHQDVSGYRIFRHFMIFCFSPACVHIVVRIWMSFLYFDPVLSVMVCGIWEFFVVVVVWYFRFCWMLGSKFDLFVLHWAGWQSQLLGGQACSHWWYCYFLTPFSFILFS